MLIEMSNNSYLSELENKSIYIIREAYWEHKDNLAVLWSMGKDSTALVHLARKAFFGEIPMLHWREIDIWRYIKKESLPIVNLYLAEDGKRYRSIGCKCCCQPVASTADSIDKIIREIESTSIAERSGRSQDKEKEYMMQKLRSLGYM
jgi:sulfate adenylyltransferase subunit 2